MALGGVLMFGVAGPLLASQGLVPDASYASIAAFAVWPAVGIVTGSALGAQLQALRIATAGSAAKRRPGQHRRRWVVATSLGLAFVAAIAMMLAFPTPARSLPLAVATALAVLVVAGVSVHAMATTDAVPVKALAPMAQAVAAVAAPGSLVVCAVLPHVACAAGLSAADTATSLRALDRTLPATVAPAAYGRAERTVLAHRMLGAAVGAVTTMMLLPLVVPNATGFRPTESVPGPAVLLWSATTALLSHGLSGLPAAARGCLGAGLAVGLAWSFLEERVAPKTRARIPSMVALGGALVLPPSLSLTLLLGALLQAMAARRGQGGAAKLTGVGAVAGESLGTLLGLCLGR
jgi:hypothetical protein